MRKEVHGGAASNGAHAHASSGGGGGGGGAAAAVTRPKLQPPPVAHAIGCEGGFENPCPICLDNKDDACLDGNNSDAWTTKMMRV